MIKNVVQNARRNNLQARPQRAIPINLDESNKLIHKTVHGNITHEEALNKMADINDSFRKITELKSFNSNQIKVVNKKNGTLLTVKQKVIIHTMIQ